MPTTDRAAPVKAGLTNGMPSPEAILETLEVSKTDTRQDKKADVSTPSIDYTTMASRWALIDDLRGGTLRMREASTTWLPRDEKEGTIPYDVRVSRSFLFEAYNDAVRQLSHRPFSRNVSVLGKLPTSLEPLIRDTDRTGRTLTQLAAAMLSDAIHHGKTHLLIDFPPMPPGATLADEREAKARPFFVHIPATDLIGWKVSLSSTGLPFLSEIRFKEVATVYTGVWGEEQRDRIRVYRRNSWELWERRKMPKGSWKWVSTDSGFHTFGAIPLVTLYTDRTAFMMSRPALEPLAWMNLSHFQSSSDQKNLLRFARIGILFGAGFTSDEVKAGINLSPASLIATTNENASLEYVEHTGAAMEIGAKDLEATEQQMDILAMKPLVNSGTGIASATGTAIEEAKAQSALQTWARAEEIVIEQAFEIAAKWAHTPLPTDFKVDIFNDFSISPRVRDDVLALLEARGLGEISRATLLMEMQRRGLLVDHLDLDQEEKDAKKDGPPESGVGRGGGTGNRIGSLGKGSRDQDDLGDDKSVSKIRDADTNDNPGQANSPR